MSELYADASALTKLVLDEDESTALRAHAAGVGLAASALARVEVTRAARVRGVDTAAVVPLWSRVELVPVDDRVLALATELADLRLGSLDAVHLASALLIDAKEMLVYDRDLAAAAARVGIRALSPGR